jgi:tetratricopeptide (TPR) repeat protein
MEAQLQIRQNAQEVQDYMKDLFAWEKSVKSKAGKTAKAGSSAAAAPPPPPRGQATGPPSGGSQGDQGRSAAGHTYSNYNRWDKFDADAAMADGSDDEERAGKGGPALADPSAPPIRGSAPAVAAAGASSSRTDKPAAAAAAAAKQGAKPAAKRAASPEPTTADSWKDRGNKLLQAGHLQEATTCYDRSLAVRPTSLAHANRALARLKLKQFAAAEADATAALALDGAYAKAWQRRAAARREMGRWLEAAEDLEEALRLEPGNKAVRADRDAALEEHLRAAGVRRLTARRRLPVVERAVVEPPPPAVAAVAAVAQKTGPVSDAELLRPRQQQPVRNPQPAVAADSEKAGAATASAAAAATQLPAKQIEPSASAAPSPAVAAAAPSPAAATEAAPQSASPAAAAAAAMASLTPTSGPQPAAAASVPAAPRPSSAQPLTHRERQQQQVAAAAAAAAEQVAARMAGGLKAPKSSVEFESTWRALKGDAPLQLYYLSLIDGAQLPAIFKDSLTPGVLVAIARAALSAAAAAGGCAGGEGGLAPAAAVGLLAGLTKVPRFAMMAMCLGSKEKGELRGLWDAAAVGQLVLGLAGQLQALRPAFKV